MHIGMKRIDADSVRLHSAHHYIKSMTVQENYGPYGSGIVERVLIDIEIMEKYPSAIPLKCEITYKELKS